MAGQIDELDLDGAEMSRMEAMVQSMTLQERRDPDLIESSRRKRIAAGAGVEVHDVSGLVKTFTRSRDMLKSLSGGSLGGLRSLLSGGLNMGALGQMMSSAGRSSSVPEENRLSSEEARSKESNRRVFDRERLRGTA